MDLSERIPFFSTPELVMVGIIAMLLLFVLLLLVYAFVLRFLHNRRERHVGQRRARWERAVFDYMDSMSMYSDVTGRTKAVDISRLEIEAGDWLVFGEFAEHYLVNIDGREHDRIVQFIRDTGYPRMLMAALDRRSEWEKAYGAYLLGLLRHEPAASRIAQLVMHQSSIVSITAFEALTRIESVTRHEDLVRRILNNRDVGQSKFSDVILRCGNEIFPMLMRLLDDPGVNNTGRRRIIDVLTFRNVVESGPLITRLAGESTDMEVLIGCMKAIAVFGDPESIDTVRRYLDYPRWELRSQAVRAYGAVGSIDIIPDLADILVSDDNFWVRHNSAEMLAGFGETGRLTLEGIREATDDESLRDLIGYILYERDAA